MQKELKRFFPFYVRLRRLLSAATTIYILTTKIKNVIQLTLKCDQKYNQNYQEIFADFHVTEMKNLFDVKLSSKHLKEDKPLCKLDIL